MCLNSGKKMRVIVMNFVRSTKGRFGNFIFTEYVEILWSSPDLKERKKKKKKEEKKSRSKTFG